MPSRTKLFISLVRCPLAFVLVVLGLASFRPVTAKGAPPVSDTPLDATYLSNDPVTSATNAIRSDGQGVYSNGINNLWVILFANGEGNYRLDTNTRTNIDGGRRLVLDFGAQLPLTGGPPNSGGVINANGTMVTRSVNFTGDNLRELTANQSLPKRMHMSWTAGKNTYALKWDGPENGHGFVTFTCTLTDPLGLQNSTCSTWDATPGSATAGLYLQSKNNSPDQPVLSRTGGNQYSMPFFIRLVKKGS